MYMESHIRAIAQLSAHPLTNRTNMYTPTKPSTRPARVLRGSANPDGMFCSIRFSYRACGLDDAVTMKNPARGIHLALEASVREIPALYRRRTFPGRDFQKPAFVSRDPISYELTDRLF